MRDSDRHYQDFPEHMHSNASLRVVIIGCKSGNLQGRVSRIWIILYPISIKNTLDLNAVSCQREESNKDIIPKNKMSYRDTIILAG